MSPKVSAQGAAAGHLRNHEAKLSAAEATTTTPAKTELRVSQYWTKPRKRPGCSAMASAATAPSPPDSARRRSFSFLAETTAVSAAVMNPFAAMRSPSRSSS